MTETNELIRQGVCAFVNGALKRSELSEPDQQTVIVRELVNAAWLLALERNLEPLAFPSALRRLADDFQRGIVALSIQSMEQQVGAVTETDRANVDELRKNAMEALDNHEGAPLGTKPGP